MFFTARQCTPEGCWGMRLVNPVVPKGELEPYEQLLQHDRNERALDVAVATVAIRKVLKHEGAYNPALCKLIKNALAVPATLEAALPLCKTAVI